MLLDFHYISNHFVTNKKPATIRVTISFNISSYEQTGDFSIEFIYDDSEGYDISKYNVPYEELKLIKIKSASIIDDYIKMPHYYSGDY